MLTIFTYCILLFVFTVAFKFALVVFPPFEFELIEVIILFGDFSTMFALFTGVTLSARFGEELSNELTGALLTVFTCTTLLIGITFPLELVSGTMVILLPFN